MSQKGKKYDGERSAMKCNEVKSGINIAYRQGANEKKLFKCTSMVKTYQRLFPTYNPG